MNPYLIELVQDRDGETRYRGDKRDCRACTRGFDGGESPRLDPPGEQVMDPITAYQIAQPGSWA